MYIAVADGTEVYPPTPLYGEARAAAARFPMKRFAGVVREWYEDDLLIRVDVVYRRGPVAVAYSDGGLV